MGTQVTQGSTDGLWDVVVVGGGNAGLCAGISAAENGSRVLVVERAQKRFRGGNSSLTMNMRFPHERLEQLLQLIDREDLADDQTATLANAYLPYPEEAFLSDLVSTSNGLCDRALAEELATGAYETVAWLRGAGHRWECKATILPGAVPIRLKGGGEALQHRSFEIAERLGVHFEYDCRFVDLVFNAHGLTGLTIEQAAVRRTIHARTVILACGGYQANPKLRRRYLGKEWEDVALRGVPYNCGDGHEVAEKIGAILTGDFESCHATPQDSRLTAHMLPGSNEESQRNSRYAFNYGVTVNLRGERFFDEGQDLPNFVYAKFGAAIIAQQEGIAFQIFDSKTAPLLPRPYFETSNFYRGESLAALAYGLGIDVAGFERTMKEYNRGAARSDFDLLRVDGLSTKNVHPPKSNWAMRLDEPPFYGCPVRAGITFTYGGIAINCKAEVLNRNNQPITGLFAAGEIVGGLFWGNYAGGTGLMAGSHFGRIAGRMAARAATSLTGEYQ